MLIVLSSHLRARFLSQEKLNGVGRRTTVVTTREKDRNVHCECITTGVDHAKAVFREEAMTLVHLELVKGVETILAATCVEGVLGPTCLFHINFDFAVFHADVGELLTDQRQRLGVPKLGEGSVVSLSNEKHDETDDKESHEDALHGVLLSEDDGVEWLR